MDEVLTIGVYGWSLEAWLDALAGAGADEVWDVRDRRGLRGASDRWANGNLLEAHLANAGFGYRHLRALAPPTPLRTRLQEDDKRQGLRHRDRTTLPPWFADEYRSVVLSDIDGLLDAGGSHLGNAERPALLCVEGPAAACHRSLTAEALAARGDGSSTSLPIRHLGSPGAAHPG